MEKLPHGKPIICQDISNADLQKSPVRRNAFPRGPKALIGHNRQMKAAGAFSVAQLLAACLIWRKDQVRFLRHAQ